MINNSEIYEILNNLGLDEDEIKSINRRNKLLDETISDDVITDDFAESIPDGEVIEEFSFDEEDEF